MIREACVGTVEDAVRAQSNGADQIELCDRLDLDGTTPPLELVRSVVGSVEIPVKVILNPVPFNYRYTEIQTDAIAADAKRLASAGVSGLVFGALTKDRLPDIAAVKKIASATPLPVTFHKAIDQSADILRSLKMLIASEQIKFVLSSGGEKTAVAGQGMLDQMNQLIQASGNSIALIAAGSITSDNLSSLHAKLGLWYYHGKRIVDN